MFLYPEPFEFVKSWNKTIEMRLFDEKGQKVRPKDVIVFTNSADNWQRLAVEVAGLSIFPSFRELFSAFSKEKFGHPSDITIEKQVQRLRTIYSEEQERKYGVVGIHIKLLSKIPDYES